MPTTETITADRLAEFLVNAAAQLVPLGPTSPRLAPLGVPVRRGRIHLGRVLSSATDGGHLVCVVGFGTAAWLGAPAGEEPTLSGLRYRADTSIDPRGRVQLDRRVRGWLAVADPDSFDVVVSAVHGGVWVVPLEDFDSTEGILSVNRATAPPRVIRKSLPVERGR